MSGIETAGLPQGWVWTTVGELALSMKNGIYKPRDAYSPDGIACLRMYNIEKGLIVWRDIKRMTISPAETEEYGLLAGDILVNRVNSRELVGKAAVIPYGMEQCVFESKNIRLRTNEKAVSPRYLNYRLLEAGARYFSATAQQTVGMATVNQPQLARFSLPLAPLPEQYRIIAEIEKQFTRLDAGVAALERVRAKLKRYRAAVLKAAVEGRLVPTEADLARAEGREYEPANLLLARILKRRRANWEQARSTSLQVTEKARVVERLVLYREPVAPDLSDLPKVPEGWTLASMDQLTTTITSGSRDWSRYYGRGSGVFILVQNIKPMKLDLSYRQRVDPPEGDRDRKRSQIRQNDLLVTIVGNAGTLCRVRDDMPEHFVCQSVALMRPVEEALSRFLEVYLSSDENGQRQYRRYLYGAGRGHLSFDQLKMTGVLLPPVPEQERIVDEVERRLSVIEELEAIIDTNLKRADRLRQAILKRAFEGKLVPQDPDDEPASVLLERIRAERNRDGAPQRRTRPAKVHIGASRAPNPLQPALFDSPIQKLPS